MTIECRPMTLKSRDVFWQRMRIIQESRLRLKHKAVLIWLLVYAGDDDEAWPLQPDWASAAGISTRQLQRILSGLRESRLVFVKRSRDLTRYEVDWQAVKTARPIDVRRTDMRPFPTSEEPATPGEG